MAPAALAALLGLSVPVMVDAKPNRQGGPLSIEARPSPTVFGSPTTTSGDLRGQPRAGVAVVLEQKPYPFTGAFTELATTTTNSQGRYSFRPVPQLNTRYRTTARTTPPLTSGELLVPVAIRVGFRVSDSTPRRGQLVRFFGSATPQHDGRLVKIQRRTSTGSYRTVARTRLADAGESRSTYTRRLRIRSDGVYRVQVPADLDHATGVSRSRRLRVH